MAVLAAAFALPVAAPAQTVFGSDQNKTTPALTALRTALAAVNDYRTTATVFERTDDGKRTSTRRYEIEFVKPDRVLAIVGDGPGRGSAFVWAGGPTVTGHEGPPLAVTTLTYPIDDPRTTTLRGDALDTASFAFDLRYMLATRGTLTEKPGPVIDGSATTAIALSRFMPAAGEITKVVLAVSNATHLPVRRQALVGETVVKSETFADTKVNVGLRPGDLDAAAAVVPHGEKSSR